MSFHSYSEISYRIALAALKKAAGPGAISQAIKNLKVEYDSTISDYSKDGERSQLGGAIELLGRSD
jgi:hypothetical protein